MNACWLGQTRRLLDQTTDAVAALDRGLGISLDGPFLPGEMLARAELARALVALGEHDQATEHLARCDKIFAAGEDWRGRTGVVELARGAVATARGEPEAAHAAYAHANEVFSAYRLPWWRAQTLHARAWAHATVGRTDEAQASEHAAAQCYDALGAAPRWQRAPTP